jgi:tetratricopeptide (TPR) repeat protein
MRRLAGAIGLVLWCGGAGFAQEPPAEYFNALKNAEEMRTRGDLEGVVRALDPWVEKYPDRAELRHALGLAYYQQNNLAGAIRHLSASLKLEPENSSPWKQTVETLAMSYYFSNRTQDALPLLEKAVTWNLGDTYYLYALAMTYVYTRDRDAARRTFARLFDIEPDSPQAAVLTSHFLVRENFLAEGEALIREAQKSRPDLPDINYRLGLIALSNGALQQAIEHLEKELATNPMHPMAWHYLGDIRIRMGKLDQAIAALQRAIWLNLRATESYVLISTAYTQLGKYSEAEQALKRALELAPQNYEAHFQLARIYHKTNRPELAKKEIDIANKLRAESEPKR